MDTKAPTWVLNAVTGKFLGDDAPTPSAPTPSSSSAAFTPAASFRGAKPGFYFGKGDRGVGYYRDSHQALPGGEDGGAAGTSEVGKGQPLDAEELLRQAEEDVGIDDIQVLDAKSLKRLVIGFERKYKENMEQRMKHADQPEKFMDSEVDLDEHVKSLLQVAGSPELYPVLVEMNVVPTLLACLSHENVDIAADAVELLMELTSADAVEEFQEEAKGLVQSMLAANALELLVQRLVTFNERVSEEEAAAVNNCLSIFENMVEVDTDIAEQVVDKTRLLKWLLGRIRAREFDVNKQYASEILAILVQGNENIQKKIGEVGGIDTLLQCVAQYKNKDPHTLEEEEFMQNCFDVLCSCLMIHENKLLFAKSEGVELIWIMLQIKKQARYGAIKALDFISTRYAAPCEKFIDLGGLKNLFGVFMGKSRIKGPRGERDVDTEIEERSVSIISNLMQNLGARGGRRERVAAKFVENEFEKCDRLMEIYFRYYERVLQAQTRLFKDLEDAGEEDVEEEEIMAARNDAGLFTLQQCVIILAQLWSTGDVGLRKRVLMLLHQKGQALSHVRELLVEYFYSIGTDGSSEESQRLRSRATELLLAIGHKFEEEEEEEEEAAPPPPMPKDDGELPPMPPPLPDMPPPPLPSQREDEADARVSHSKREGAPSGKQEPAGATKRRKVDGDGEEEDGRRDERGRREREKERDRDREKDKEKHERREREEKERESKEHEREKKDRDREAKDRDREAKDRDREAKEREREAKERESKDREAKEREREEKDREEEEEDRQRELEERESKDREREEKEREHKEHKERKEHKEHKREKAKDKDKERDKERDRERDGGSRTAHKHHKEEERGSSRRDKERSGHDRRRSRSR